MASNEKPCDFGHYLQLHRRAKGKSLQQVALATKVPVSLLQQLENEEIDKLPAPVFVKGFVRAYAAAVGADSQDALQRFEACYAIRGQILPDVPIRKDKGYPFWIPLLLGLALLVAMIVLTLTVAPWMDGHESPSPAADSAPVEPATGPHIDSGIQTPVEPTSEPPAGSGAQAHVPDPEPLIKDHPGGPAGATAPTEDSFDLAKPERVAVGKPDEMGVIPAQEGSTVQPPVTPPVPEPPLVLQIRALETTWLQVRSDGHPPREMTLQPGKTITLKAADQFQLLIGNAGGITLTFNDQLIGVPGKSGQVKNLVLP